MKKKCKDIMTRDLKCLSPSDTIQKAASQMKEGDIGSLLICEAETGKLSGIVTDRDIVIKHVAQGLSPEESLEKIVTWNPVSCVESDSVDKAMDIMAEHQIRRLPIVDSNGTLVGIISQGDIATRMQEPKKVAEVVKEVSESPSDQYRQEHAQPVM